jgi:hypothetical protein
VPQVYQSGKVDEAVLFDGFDDHIQWQSPLKQPLTSAFTVAMWFKTKAAPVENTTLLSLNHAAAVNWKTKGGVTFSVTDNIGQTFEASSNLELSDGQWHHVAGVWNGTALYIYIDGVQVGTQKPTGMGLVDTSTSLLTLGNNVTGVNGFSGWVDEVYFFLRGFTNQEAAYLFGLGNRTWNLANLAGEGLPVTTWSYALPSGLDGLYEIDLRGVDYLGNRDDNPSSWNAWQGEIDTLAPRVSLQTVDQGITTQVRCTSIDFNLSRTGYQCPCVELEGDATTYDQWSSWYRTVTSDQARLYRILSTCNVDSSNAPFQVQACDSNGRCSTTSSLLSVQEASPETTTTPEDLATPEVTATAEATSTPEETATAEATSTPEAPDTPEATSTPEPTPMLDMPDTPEVTSTFEVTETHQITSNPEAPALQEISAMPGVENPSEITITPESNVTQEFISTLEATATPATSETPAGTATQQATMTPQTETPVDTATPEVTATTHHPRYRQPETSTLELQKHRTSPQ